MSRADKERSKRPRRQRTSILEFDPASHGHTGARTPIERPPPPATDHEFASAARTRRREPGVDETRLTIINVSCGANIDVHLKEFAVVGSRIPHLM